MCVVVTSIALLSEHTTGGMRFFWTFSCIHEHAALSKLTSMSDTVLKKQFTCVGGPLTSLHPQITEKCQAQGPAQAHFFQTTTLTGSPAHPNYTEKVLWLYSDSLPLIAPADITHLGSGSSEVLTYGCCGKARRLILTQTLIVSQSECAFCLVQYCFDSFNKRTMWNPSVLEKRLCRDINDATRRFVTSLSSNSIVDIDVHTGAFHIICYTRTHQWVSIGAGRGVWVLMPRVRG